MLYVFTRTKELRTPANSFVVNLALSDMCVIISQSPMFVANCFAGGVWLFGPFWCEFYAFMGLVFSICSICTMAAISYDRYNIIVNGMSGTRIRLGKFLVQHLSTDVLPRLLCDRKSTKNHSLLLDLCNRMEYSTIH